MNLMKTIFRRCVPGSSLIEVITSFLIISIVFGLGAMIYVNIQRASMSTLRLSANQLLQAVYTETLQTETYTPREANGEDITVYQEVTPYAANEALWWLHLEARDRAGHIIATRNHLIYAPS